MNRSTIFDPDPDKLLQQALKEDLPPEVEARMSRRFFSFKRTLGRPESPVEADVWVWMHGVFRKEILTVASATLLMLGVFLHLSGSPSALAHTIEQLKVMVTVSMNLNRAVSMDCTILKPEAGGETVSYHVRWRANGDARVDRVSSGGAQTLWLSERTLAVTGSDGGLIRSLSLNTLVPGPVWQTALEFGSPRLLAKQMETQYGMLRSEQRNTGQFLILGHEDGQAIEVAIDEKTYLPKALKKYRLDADGTNRDRDCLMEVRFQWNQPIFNELFVPGPLAGKQ